MSSFVYEDGYYFFEDENQPQEDPVIYADVLLAQENAGVSDSWYEEE